MGPVVCRTGPLGVDIRRPLLAPVPLAPASTLRQLRARERGLFSRSDFGLTVSALRQKIAKLSGFSAIQTRLTFPDDLDQADADKSESHRVRFLMA